jgi:2-haloacid dehalogenase
MTQPIDTIIWDIGNVLFYWDPRDIYRNDPRFTPADLDEWSERVIKNPWAPGERGWNAELDLGRTFAETLPERTARFPQIFPHLVPKYPDYADLLAQYGRDFEKAIQDRVPGTEELRRVLRQAGYRTLALSNFSPETWPRAVKVHPFINDFDGVAVSGFVGMVKPDRDIFDYLIQAHQVDPSWTVFIDDSLDNLEVAGTVGLHTVHFQTNRSNPKMALGQLVGDLLRLGIVVPGVNLPLLASRA